MASFIRRVFSKSKSDDFETILSELQRDIQKRQSQLSELRLRERRTTLLVTLYALVFWLLYLGGWYISLRHKRVWYLDVVVIVGPIFILFVRRIVQVWYKRKGDAEEKTLQALRKTQRTKIDEFKKKTNFYETRSLLAKYDEDAPGLQTPARPGPANRPSPKVTIPPVTPARNPPRQSMVSSQGPLPPQLLSGPAPNSASPLPPHIIGAFPPPVYTPRKQWYDKLADALLGDDEGTSGGDAATRYALICQQCFKHNGLVKESMWEDAQYVCPKCGHFNPSQRSKREGLSKQPRSSISPSPVRHTASPSASDMLAESPSNRRLGAPSIVVSGGDDDDDDGDSVLLKDNIPDRKGLKLRARRVSGGDEDEGNESMMQVDS